MNIYIDESGSINNKLDIKNDFIIALVNVYEKSKLERAYKRFISSNLKRLYVLDKKARPRKMFRDGKFFELKGFLLDKDMKNKFVEYFTRKPLFELYYIRIYNSELSDIYCKNTSRTFNYCIRLAMESFFKNGFLCEGNYCLQLDERNEKKETRHFLSNYLNTELVLNKTVLGEFEVNYYNSNCNTMIQIADVFANLLYSHIRSGAFGEEMEMLRERNILKTIFEFGK